MNANASVTPAWLPGLIGMVQAELAQSQIAQQDQEPDLRRELEALQENIHGWMMSLANKDLDTIVRCTLESQWAAAEKRKREIEQSVLAAQNREQRTADAVDEATVVERLRNLSDVLANHGPTRANLELSLHIDRITCDARGRVTLRTSKLGALPEVSELLNDIVPTQGDRPAIRVDDSVFGLEKQRNGPRRRGWLRTADYDDAGGVDPREIADFVADTNRFASLSEQWFWIDEFQIPVKRSWVEENADTVFRRQNEVQETTGKKPTLKSLADEFGVSRPTIATALDIATGKRLTRKERRAERRKFTMPLDEDARREIVRLYHEDQLEQREVGRRCGVHRSTVERVLNDWDKERGIKRMDGRKRRSHNRPPGED